MVDKPEPVEPLSKGGSREQKQPPPGRRPRPAAPAKPQKSEEPPPKPRTLEEDAVSVGGLLSRGVTPEMQAVLDELAARVEPLRRELELAKEREKHLAELADRHPFLPVGSRRVFERQLGRVISHLRHLSPAPALLVVNVAGVGDVRLRHGAGAREAALKHVCSILSAELHPTDALGSLGGDDLGIVLLIADEASARAKAARLVDAIRARPLAWQGALLALDAAAGLALLAPGDTAQAALGSADRDLVRGRAARAASAAEQVPALTR